MSGRVRRYKSHGYARRAPDAVAYTLYHSTVKSAGDLDDFRFLMKTAAIGRAAGISNFLHLDQPIGIWNYIRIANDIRACVPPGRLLDWGCGLGQMSYLLQRRGFEVVSYDMDTTAASLPDLPLTRAVSIVRGADPVRLPFSDAEFDAVLSCGVLEHVDEYSAPGNERLSLQEIHRVLKPDGFFPIYQLPQQCAWQEAIARVLKNGYTHPRRFSEGEIRRLLSATGFRVVRLRRFNMLPKNMTGLPTSIRAYYSRLSGTVFGADGLLSSVPILNRLAGVLEVLAQKARPDFA